MPEQPASPNLASAIADLDKSVKDLQARVDKMAKELEDFRGSFKDGLYHAPVAKPAQTE